MEEGARKSFLEEVLVNCRSSPGRQEREKPLTPPPPGSRRPRTGFGFPGIPRVFGPRVPVNQASPPGAGYGFKGGCSAESSQNAARRAGLDFKSPRPISSA